ncbi:MAG TPA: tetratricopeptide repeat protein [Candidatus Polarisedimenticolaceae bacterium]
MSVDREKTFANAEKLLKQGRPAPALEEFRRVAEASPRDVLMLNRIGDALARAGRNSDALGYYEKAADHFTQAGFYPKAAAILAKVAKIDPHRVEVLVRMADLHVKQKRPADARRWFLAAAEQHLKAREFGKAREVYERMVQAEPAEALHRVRLAEARAAEGDAPRASEDLLVVADQWSREGRHEEAERTYRRAADLGPQRAEPWAGMAQALAARGRGEEAVRLLDEGLTRLPDHASLLAEKVSILGLMGRDDAAGALIESRADALSEEQLERLFGEAASRGSAEPWFARLEAVLDRWEAAARHDRALGVLERLATLDAKGFLPALDRLVRVRRLEGGAVALSAALGRMRRALEAHGRADRLAAIDEELRGLDAPKAPAPAPAPAVAPVAAVAAPVAEEPSDPGAPAVPLSPADHEWVSGHLTEAEVFQKYGLQVEALQQLREVAQRFPGHVVGVERLAAMLRARGERGELAETLATLAIARRAAGDVAGARHAADEAAAMGTLGPARRRSLEALVSPPAAPEAAAAAPSPSAPVEELEELVIEPAPPPEAAERAAKAPAPAAAPVESDDEFEISFDDEEPVESPAASAPPVAARGRAREATPDMIEEIAFYLDQGMVPDARKKIEALRMLGFAGAELDALEARVAAPAAPSEPVAEEEVLIAEEESEPTTSDDLIAITAALEAELGFDAPPAPETQAGSLDEQSLQDVFDAFKKHVELEVGSEDYRTHYDLGIAYKEMGLIDDAMGEFRNAMRSPALFRDAASMLAMCHRERGEHADAAALYRQALAAAGDEGDPLYGMRYDLADTLEATGELRSALDLFQEVLQADPGYREVRQRVADLQVRLRS